MEWSCKNGSPSTYGEPKHGFLHSSLYRGTHYLDSFHRSSPFLRVSSVGTVPVPYPLPVKVPLPSVTKNLALS